MTAVEIYLNTTHKYAPYIEFQPNELATHIWIMGPVNNQVGENIFRNSFQLDRERAEKAGQVPISFSTPEMDQQLALPDLLTLASMRDIIKLAPEVWSHLIKEQNPLRTWQINHLIEATPLQRNSPTFATAAVLDIPIDSLREELGLALSG